jgi:hypothetical protein
LSAFPDPGSLGALLIDPNNRLHVAIAASSIEAGGAARADFYLSTDGQPSFRKSRFVSRSNMPPHRHTGSVRQ